MLLAGRLRDSFLVVATAAAAIAALDAIGYAAFLMPLGRVTLGSECVPTPPSVEEHGWLLFLPSTALLVPGFVSLAFNSARARRVRAASIGASLLLFFGTLTWVHGYLLDLALERFGGALNPVGVGEPIAVVVEGAAVALLSVALVFDSDPLGRGVGLVALVASGSAAWFSAELIRHPASLYDGPILLGQRGVLVAAALGMLVVWVSSAPVVTWRSLAPAPAVTLLALACVAATRGHAWDRDHPLDRLWNWGYPDVAGLDPPVSQSRMCSTDAAAQRYVVTGAGIEHSGRVLAPSEVEPRLHEDHQVWTDLFRTASDDRLPALEIVTAASAPPPVTLLRQAHAAGFELLVGQRLDVSELTGARGWITRKTRCVVPLRVRADGAPVTGFTTWSELALAAEAGAVVSLE